MHAMFFSKKPNALKCPACGGDVEVGWKYCLNCGKQLNGQAAGGASTSFSTTVSAQGQQPFIAGGLNVVSQLVDVGDTGFHTGSAGGFTASSIHTGTGGTGDSSQFTGLAEQLVPTSGITGTPQQSGNAAPATRVKLVPLTGAAQTSTLTSAQYDGGSTSVFGEPAQADKELDVQVVPTGGKHLANQMDATISSQQVTYGQDFGGTTVFGADEDEAAAAPVDVVKVEQFRPVASPGSLECPSSFDSGIVVEQNPVVQRSERSAAIPGTRETVSLFGGLEPEEDDPDSPTYVYEEEPQISVRRLSTGQVYECVLPAVLGKGTRSTVMLAGNRGISRRHAILTESDGHYFLKDNASSNGTYVNDRRLGQGESTILEAGDIFRLANEEFEFLVD